MTMTMRVYRVSSTGERETVSGTVEYKGSLLAMASSQLPACRCQRCESKFRMPAERAAVS